MTTLTITDMHKSFGEVRAVDGVSLEVREGELFFLLGPSGCGKTTLLRTVAGFCEPDRGELRFGNRLMNSVPPHRRNTGMVFQSYALWPHMSVWGNVAYGLELRPLARSEVRQRVAEALELVRLTSLEKRRPNTLSGGQQQRVALARALVIRPDVLLLDEPLSNLDAKLRVEMRKELRRIHQQLAITTLYVTHDQKEALSLAERMAVMRDGRIEQVGTPQEVYLRPAGRFVAEFIGQANVLGGHAEAGADGETSIRTPYGVIRAGASVRGPVLWCVRPEALRINVSPREYPNQLSGTVEDVSYLGDQEQVVLRLSAPDRGREVIHVLLHHPGDAVPRPGETVAVGFNADDVIVIPGEGGSPS